MVARIGEKAPNLYVSTWVQGEPTNIDKEKGNVVLVEVFQVNCPGCFIYGIPEAIDIYNEFKGSGLSILGLATAFEDFDKNNLENLHMLLTAGKVIGETYRALAQYGKLTEDKKLPYKIPFPVGMDVLKKETDQLTNDKVIEFIKANVPDYGSYSEKDKQTLLERVKQYLRTKLYSAKTFEEYVLRGTPSSILVDRHGILRHTFFGSSGYLKGAVLELMNEN